jgi:hypothetical protein
MTDAPDRQVDPLEGQEVGILNAMLAQVHPAAKAGDLSAIDRVIKILELKRKYREDREADAERWRV